METNPVYALAPLAAASLWGGMYVVSKWGFSAIPPVTLGFLRVVIGAAVLLVVVRRARPAREFSRTDRRRFVALGVAVTATIVTQFVGTDLTNASQGALLTVLTPVFTLLLGVSALSEPMTRRKSAGMALAAVGTLSVLAGRYDLTRMASGNAVGVAALLVASLAWAAYTVYGKPLVRAYSALETATYSTVAAVPMLGVLAAAELAVSGFSLGDVPLSLPVAGAVLYLGVLSTAVAWYLWYKGLEFVDAGTVAVFFFVQPLVGALLGALLLGEAIGPDFVVGGAVMAVGVYIVSTSTTS
ncbi:DMT family transporter [Halorussus sp. MSC15.2]|uniref:DMT family transporter n=1 Tax=Halorussus sp. MSC15.2 TaxID=2283638 RepID=UPI0013D5E2DF|nr:EamA family transporter [Halorussus sp. MSC15.2]NEU58312.1 EamA family transporter [Halorussus sp. MSC15.2]